MQPDGCMFPSPPLEGVSGLVETQCDTHGRETPTAHRNRLAGHQHELTTSRLLEGLNGPHAHQRASVNPHKAKGCKPRLQRIEALPQEKLTTREGEAEILLVRMKAVHIARIDEAAQRAVDDRKTPRG